MQHISELHRTHLLYLVYFTAAAVRRLAGFADEARTALVAGQLTATSNVPPHTAVLVKTSPAFLEIPAGRSPTLPVLRRSPELRLLPLLGCPPHSHRSFATAALEAAKTHPGPSFPPVPPTVFGSPAPFSPGPAFAIPLSAHDPPPHHHTVGHENTHLRSVGQYLSSRRSTAECGLHSAVNTLSARTSSAPLRISSEPPTRTTGLGAPIALFRTHIVLNHLLHQLDTGIRCCDFHPLSPSLSLASPQISSARVLGHRHCSAAASLACIYCFPASTCPLPLLSCSFAFLPSGLPESTPRYSNGAATDYLRDESCRK